MKYKADAAEAKERMAAWWDHETTDRPVISYYMPNPTSGFRGYTDPWVFTKHLDQLE
jgi:hypothetical protein